jgi:hypothetical protein
MSRVAAASIGVVNAAAARASRPSPAARETRWRNGRSRRIQLRLSVVAVTPPSDSQSRRAGSEATSASAKSWGPSKSARSSCDATGGAAVRATMSCVVVATRRGRSPSVMRRGTMPRKPTSRPSAFSATSDGSSSSYQGFPKNTSAM